MPGARCGGAPVRVRRVRAAVQFGAGAGRFQAVVPFAPRALRAHVAGGAWCAAVPALRGLPRRSASACRSLATQSGHRSPGLAGIASSSALASIPACELHQAPELCAVLGGASTAVVAAVALGFALAWSFAFSILCKRGARAAAIGGGVAGFSRARFFSTSTSTSTSGVRCRYPSGSMPARALACEVPVCVASACGAVPVSALSFPRNCLFRIACAIQGSSIAFGGRGSLPVENFRRWRYRGICHKSRPSALYGRMRSAALRASRSAIASSSDSGRASIAHTSSGSHSRFPKGSALRQR